MTEHVDFIEQETLDTASDASGPTSPSGFPAASRS